MLQLKTRYTIAIVTHNLQQQAQRVADKTGFLYVDTSEAQDISSSLETLASSFRNPQKKHTKDCIRGEFS